MSSFVPGQWAQSFIGFILILYRCPLSGQWDVHSHVSMHMWEQHNPTMSIRYDPDRIFGSILLVYIDLGDFFQRHCHLSFSFFRCDCSRAEVLLGRGLFWRYWGSFPDGLVFWSLATFFASSSTLSFPAIPLCPAIHHTLMSSFVMWCFFWAHFIILLNWLIR